MIFWIVVMLAGGGLGLVLARPLLRGVAATVASRAEYDMTVYRDQLTEIERDRARGVLTDDQATAARAEVERRLLAAAEARDKSPGPARTSPAPLIAAVLAIAVPALAIVLYAQLGRPGLPGQPLADRRDLQSAPSSQSADRHPGGPAGSADSMQSLTERLAKRLEANPNDAEGWSLLARSYQQLERHRDAVGALERAAALTNRDPALVSALGEARIMAADGTVPEQARAEFEEVLKQQPKDPRARFYIALAEGQAGRLQVSLDRLVALAKDTPADAPFLPMVRDRISGLARELKQDPTKVMAGLPEPQAAPPQQQSASPPPAAREERGPSQADMAAAAQMSPEQRQQMIQGMVAGLAQRLEENPADVEGWLRLIRAFKVMGEDAKASDAVSKAIAANPLAQPRIVSAAQQLGVNVAQAPQAASPAPAPAAPPAATPGPAPARGPTAADMAAAQQMSPEARQQMIRGMVDGLAARMEQQPNDVEGWLRLIRAYKVLGEDAKAGAAAGKAVAANPSARPQVAALAQQLGLTLAAGPAPTAAPAPPRPLDAAAIRAGTPALDLAPLRQRLSGNPNDREALFQLGLAEAAAGNRIGAAELWGRLLGQFDPASAEYGALRERLDALKRGG